MNNRNASRVLAIALLAAPTPSTFAQELLNHWWQPDGPVYSVVEDEANGVVYVGGAFEKVGPPMYGGTPLDRNTGLPLHTAPLPNDQAYDVVPDGQGGYYLGGAFTAVDGQPRNRIAHVSASGDLLPFGGDATAGFDAGTVERMLLHDGVLYVAHRQPSITSEVVEGYAGPVSGSNGSLGWTDPVVSGGIAGVLPAPNGGWYLYGYFTQVSGVDRPGMVRVAANGAVHPWDLQLNGSVSQCVMREEVMYLSGCFSSVLGQQRRGMAAIHIPTGTLLPFSVDLSTAFGTPPCPHPYTLLPLGEKVYLHGQFEVINYAYQSDGWVDAGTGALVAPPFTANGILTSLEVHDGLAWVCGSFTTINGEPRNGFAVVDADSGELLPTPFTIAGGVVQGLLIDGGQLYIRGTFTSANAAPRSGLARIDLATGQPSAWAPDVVGSATHFLLANGQLYMSGPFSSVNGEVRSGSAAVDAQSGVLTPWQAQHPGSITLLGSSSGSIFLRAQAVTANSPGGFGLWGLDAVSGMPTGWLVEPASLGTPIIKEMLVAGDGLFIAGRFSSLNGLTRNSIAKIDLTTAQILPWDLGLNGPGVQAVALRGDELYITGGFTQVSGTPRSGFAAISAQTGAVLPLEIAFEGISGSPASIHDLALGGDTLYLVGKFWMVNGEMRSNMAAIDLQTGSLMAWALMDMTGISDPYTAIDVVAVKGDTMFVGGRFSAFYDFLNSQGAVRYGLAAIHRTTSAMLDEINAPFGQIVDIAAIEGALFAVAGRGPYYYEQLSWVGGEEHRGLVRMDLATGRPSAMQIEVDGEVYAMALVDGYLFLAGDMTAVQGVATSGVARLDANTGALLPFSFPVPCGGERDAFQVYEGRIYMGTVNGLAVHDAITGEPLAWPVQTNDRVRAMDVMDGVLYIGGDFTLVNGLSRPRVAAIDLSTDAVTPFSPAVSGPAVRSLSASHGLLAMVGVGSTVLSLYDGDLALVNVQTGEFIAAESMDGGDLSPPPITTVALDAELLLVLRNWMFQGDPLTSTMAHSSGFHAPSGRFNAIPQLSFSAISKGIYGLSPGPGTTGGSLLNVKLTEDRIYLGGWFGSVNGRQRHNLAVYTRPQRDGVALRPRVQLGGAFVDAGLMNDSLRAQGLLPEVEPYTPLNYIHVLHGGGEGADAPVYGTADDTAIVDWVVVELRDATDAAQVIATRSALLRRDGQVTDVDGVSPVAFGVPRTDYHVSIRHRNHLGVMTAAPLALAAAPVTIDFTDPLTPTFGVDAQKEVGGIRVLWPGDANFDGVVKYTGAANDRDAILVAVGGMDPVNVVSGTYATEDVNLDGAIKYVGANNDRDVILQTIGGGTPTAVRVEQVP